MLEIPPINPVVQDTTHRLPLLYLLLDTPGCFSTVLGFVCTPPVLWLVFDRNGRRGGGGERGKQYVTSQRQFVQTGLGGLLQFLNSHT